MEKLPFDIHKPQLRPPQFDTSFLGRRAQETEQQLSLFNAETDAKETKVWFQNLFHERILLLRGGGLEVPNFLPLRF